jgi:F0F1-type ATP synthase assembly protein I
MMDPRATVEGPQAGLRGAVRHRAQATARLVTMAVVAAQAVSGVVLCGAIAAGGDSHAAYSALTGTLSGVAPNFFLALKMFSLPPDAPPERLVKAVYSGELMKIVFAASMLAVAMVRLDVNVGYLLGGYLGTVVVQWFALLMPVPARRHRR